MKIAALMIVRDEEAFISLNLNYHLELGFDYIFIMNHCSTDNTGTILAHFDDDPRIIVMQENNPVFDHGRMSNKLLNFAISQHSIDWFFLIDADEFLGLESNVHQFIEGLEYRNIIYASIGWANALLNSQVKGLTTIDTDTFYLPAAERPWQHSGHFRKSIAKYHEGIEVVVGGHYFKSENNQSFFQKTGGKPFIIPFHEAKYFHFEFRDIAENLYRKWQKLADNEKDSSSSPDKPWLERINLIKAYVKLYNGNADKVEELWFNEHHTLWGTKINDENIFIDTTLHDWSMSYDKKSPSR